MFNLFYRQARLKEKDEQVKKLQSDLNELEDVIADRSLSPTLETYDSLEKTLDVFISYRRSNGSQLASLIKLILEMRNFSVFLDVDRYVIIWIRWVVELVTREYKILSIKYMCVKEIYVICELT